MDEHPSSPAANDNPQDPSRRAFLQTTLAASAALAVSATAAGAEEASSTGLPMRPLGKTGVKVSIICLGGWHIGSIKDKDEAIKIMHPPSMRA